MAKDEGISVKPDTQIGDVVLVTGGAGFLGQHVVKLLQERASDVKEIRVFDRIPYENQLGHKETKTVTSIIGDVTSHSDVNAALRGVDSVIHSAAVVSLTTFPDVEAMETVNVKGTENVLQACITNNITRLVFTSSIDIVIGFNEILNGDEDTPIPTRHLFPGYNVTKLRAENMVLGANGRILPNGARLQTVALRPTGMYGEGDKHYVLNMLRTAKLTGGTLVKFGNCKARFQQTYVGNTAWAHVMALQALRNSPNAEIAGRFFVITDDTPIKNTFQQFEPFLHAVGYKLSSFSVPFLILYVIVWVIELFLHLLAPVYKINMHLSIAAIVYSDTSYYFKRQKVEKFLGFKPLFSPKEAMEKSLRYYMNVTL